MRNELLNAYEQELRALQSAARQFAAKYPQVASALKISGQRSDDPDIDLLIQSVAFLNARVHCKITDEFPELTESFLNVLYPHYLLSVPSGTVVQVSSNPNQGASTTGYKIPKGTLIASAPIQNLQGMTCTFQTVYPTQLWPIEIVYAELEPNGPLNIRNEWSQASLKIGLRCQGGTTFAKFSDLQFLRFFLAGDAATTSYLYDIIFKNSVQVQFRAELAAHYSSSLPNTSLRPPRQKIYPLLLSKDNLQQVGFEFNESAFEYSKRSYEGYRLVSEYFAFPEKFHFIDVFNINKASQAGFSDELELVIQLRDVRPPLNPITADHFKLNCVPIVNLFEKRIDPLTVHHKQYEYPIFADHRHQDAYEIHTVKQVSGIDPLTKRVRTFEPFYSLNHTKNQAEVLYYYISRQKIADNLYGNHSFISFTDAQFSHQAPAVETILIKANCTNRDIPTKLPLTNTYSDFNFVNHGTFLRLKKVSRMTKASEASPKKHHHWKLISHLLLNHVSLTETEPLQEILGLYTYSTDASIYTQIRGIQKVESKPVWKRLGSIPGTGIVRGIQTNLTLDQAAFVGHSIFLFGSILDRFLAGYIGVNSFNYFVLKTSATSGDWHSWTPRAGNIPLV